MSIPIWSVLTKVGIDEVGIDEVGIDEVGKFTIVYTQNFLPEIRIVLQAVLLKLRSSLQGGRSLE